MNSKLLILVGVIAGIVIAASSLAGYQLIAQAERTDQEIISVIQNNPHIIKAIVAEDVNTIIDDKIEIYDKKIVTDIDQVNRTATKALERVSILDNRFLIIEAITGTSTTSSTPDSTAPCAGDFNLRAMDTSGVPDDEFSTSKSIFIPGNSESGKSYTFKVKKGGNTYMTGSGQTASDGSFLARFNDFGDAEVGQYTVEVKIDGVTDCITFDLR